MTSNRPVCAFQFFLWDRKDHQAAWDAYIAQDSYLSKHRGEYAERGAIFLPLVHRLDFSVQQDFFVSIKGRRHTFQVRADVINFTAEASSFKKGRRKRPISANRRRADSRKAAFSRASATADSVRTRRTSSEIVGGGASSSTFW